MSLTLLLWRRSPATDAAVEGLVACGAHQPTTRCRPGRLTQQLEGRHGLRGLPRRLREIGSRPLLYVPLRTELQAGEVAPPPDWAVRHLARLTRSDRVILLLPSTVEHVEQLYREHVLAGGTDELEAFLERTAAPERVEAWARATVRELAGSRATVVHADDEPDRRLADALDVDVRRLRQAAPDIRGISARGLEMLRRMNQFTLDEEELRATRRFCTRTFPAGDDGELSLLDETGHVLPTSPARLTQG